MQRGTHRQQRLVVQRQYHRQIEVHQKARHPESQRLPINRQSGRRVSQPMCSWLRGVKKCHRQRPPVTAWESMVAMAAPPAPRDHRHQQVIEQHVEHAAPTRIQVVRPGRPSLRSRAVNAMESTAKTPSQAYHCR